MFSDEIDEAIGEVAKARQLLSKKDSPQVKSSEEIDQLKSVAYAWFKTHRPRLVGGGVTEATLAAVDEPYQAVLRSTAGFARRSTYAAALKLATGSLVGLRSSSVVVPHDRSAALDPPPDFSALAGDEKMKNVLVRRWSECQLCVRAGAHLAATVMMGGLLEALFLARANKMTDKAPLFKAKTTPVDHKTKKPLLLTEWTLRPYIDVGHELGWITHSGKSVSEVLRDYRNYVHPQKEYSHGVVLGVHDTTIFWDVTKNITAQILGSTAL